MKCTTIIDPSRDEEVIIYAKKQSELVTAVQRLLANDTSELIGYKERSAVMLDISDIVCFTVEDSKVFALTENDRFMLKLRLYQIEEKLSESFIRLNQSCIANISKIQKFDASLSGTLRVIFRNGYSDYVSRRNVKNVKKRLGL